MQELLQRLLTTLASGQPVVYTALVETRGSTPQKAGAAMLVFADGAQFGTLGGGCVEAEVKRKALTLIDQRTPELLTFQLDNDYGWDDGLICGGRMKMLVDPLQPGDDVTYYETLLEVLTEGHACTEAVVLETEQSNSVTATDRIVFSETGEVIVSTCPAEVVTEFDSELRPVLQRPRPYVRKGVSYLPHLKRCRLVIVGAGHVGQKVGELACEADFDVVVVDDREEYCNRERFPNAKELVVGNIDATLPTLPLDTDTFCIIVTRGHNHDEEALYHLAEASAGYVGLIGSKRKIKLIFEDLLREGIAAEALAKVHAPVGLDIGSQSVPEIAISIVAELIARRNLGEVPAVAARPTLLDEVNKEQTC